MYGLGFPTLDETMSNAAEISNEKTKKKIKKARRIKMKCKITSKKGRMLCSSQELEINSTFREERHVRTLSFTLPQINPL